MTPDEWPENDSDGTVLGGALLILVGAVLGALVLFGLFSGSAPL